MRPFRHKVQATRRGEPQSNRAGGKTVGGSLTGTRGVAMMASVAFFTDPNTTSAAGDFTASINWGNGTSSPGAISSRSKGGFRVTGTHTYASAGIYSAKTIVTDVDGATSNASASIRVFKPAVAKKPNVGSGPGNIGGTGESHHQHHMHHVHHMAHADHVSRKPTA